MCSKPGCDRPVRARGYCSSHYSNFREKELATTGNQRVDLRRLGWDESEYESYWLWVKKELNLV
jgi:hypothetical protein